MSVSRLSDFNMASFGDDIMYTYYIDTPSGTHVLVEYNNTGNMISQDVAISLADQHNATIVSSANSDWNCHSFAWLQGLYSPSLYTHIWMNLYTPFAADSAYSHSTSPQVGAIVTYGAIHSALVLAVNTYNPMHYMPEPVFLSKWGGGYIYSHFPDNCPYTHQGFDYYMLTSS